MKISAAKVRRALVICVCIAVVAVVGLYQWITYTPYGRLDFSQGLILKVANLFGGERSISDYTPEEYRKLMDGIMLRSRGEVVPLPKVEDRRISWAKGEIPVRIYTPVVSESLPVILFFHGGGWVSGSIETHDNLCRRLAKEASAVVVSAGYSLAPEAKFPTPVDEGYAALKWVRENAASLNADADKIVVAGDSAGGTLAAAICLKSRDLKGPAVALQVLFYPATNASSFETPSHEKFGEGYLLSEEAMVWLRNHYLRTAEDVTNPYASPLLSDNLVDLPPALIITAQFDPLSSEAEDYAHKLRDAGNGAQHICVKGVLHGFVSGRSGKATEALKIVAQKIAEL
jgi:acetyl esterase